MGVVLEKDVEVVVDSISEVIATGTVEVDVVDNTDLAVSVNRKEFTIVGDELYIPKRYEDAPQWLRDLISTVTEQSYARKITDLNNLSKSLQQLLVELEVAKNTYTQSIISSNDIDERINAAITTLNSSLSGSDATIVNLISTRATPEEASAIALNTISSSINNGEIGALIGSISNTLATETEALANNIDLVHAEMLGGFENTAEAIRVTQAYVGIDETGASTGTGLLSDVQILQKQNDGIIETTTGTYDVMINPQDPNLAELVLTAEPYASWKAKDVSGIDTRLSHIGDVYIKYNTTSNGAREYVASYKFIRTTIDPTSPYSTDADGFTWALIVDQAAQDAYQQALNAYDLADNKRRVFTATPSGPYDEGDLWVREVNGSNQIWKCQVTREQLDYYNATDWSIASTDDTATVALQTGLADGTVTVKLTNAYVGTTPFLTYLTNEIDSKVGVYSGETAPVNGQPSGVATNDIYLWFTTASKVLANGTTQTYDITRTYKYSGSVWNEITTDSNITALADLADGKRTVFSGSTIPVGAVERDLWIPSATNGSYLQGEIYQYNGTSWIVATKYTADLEAVKSNLQMQIDGKVETYYQATIPTGMTSINNGDYWYCTADISTYKKGKVYKYVHATTSWIETADVSRYAFDTADGKASIFSSTSVPTAGYKVNDMLIVIGSFNNGTTTFADGVVLSSTTNRVSGFTPSDWVKKINDTEDLDAFVSATYTPTVTSLQNQVDSKIESWYTLSTSDPKSAWTDDETRAKHHGDMWYQTDTKLSYYYSSITNSWNLIDDAKAIQALADAATAQATADGKISSYYMSTLAAAYDMSNAWTATEKINNIGDLVVIWDDSTLDNNGTWRWNGTNWVTTRDKKLIAIASDITNLRTELDNEINIWASANSTLENSLRTEIINESARVESKFAYNSNVNINGVWKKSGFGLSTNYISGNGTESNPYVSEFWINASKLKFTNDNVTGQVAPFTIDATGTTPEITFNGKVSFSNVSGAPGSSGNLLYNSAPALGNEQKGWQIGWYNTNIAPVLGAGFDSWRPSGGGSVYAAIPGAPTVGGVFDVVQTNQVPVVGGSWYDASAYISSHRCTSYVTIAWYDSNDTYINEVGGSQVATASGGALTNWGRSVLFAQAPANAVKASFYVRSIVNNTDPYCFVAFAYLGKSVVGQTVHSDWSEGTSAGATRTSELTNDAGFTTLSAVASQGYVLPAEVAHAINTNTTTINGSKITTGSITAAQINVDNALINKLNVVGGIVADTITGNELNGIVINGARINGSIIKTSYLDLDGELEVLTNYHITVAMYNANPSLYTDAVYISADNEYRIPSMSNISSLEKVKSNITIGSYALYSGLFSYRTANVGHSRKAVKVRPTINIANGQYTDSSSLYSETLLCNMRITSMTTADSGSGTFRFYIGNLLIIQIIFSGNINNASVSYSGLIGSGSIAQPSSNSTISVDLSYQGISFTLNRTKASSVFGGSNSVSLFFGGNSTIIPDIDWTSGEIYMNYEGSGNISSGFRLPAITINNMI